MATDSVVQDNQKFTGCVKWFNNKSGYGFITILSETDSDVKDIFAHHSSIVVKDNLYKYLVQGEYVEFNIEKMKHKDHENQAVNICGIIGGDIMCETRHKNRDLSKNRDGFTPILRGERHKTRA